MNVLFEATFAKDLKRLKEKQLLRRVQKVIAELKDAHDLTEVRNLSKL